ncbi:MAG: response regulator [Spirochaetales bacterium]|nr:response regulator [Spirochaetales bacterium]
MKHWKIYIVEDEKINLIFLEKTLEMAGYDQIFSAHSGDKVLDLIQENPPDLLLVDFFLKGPMNGVELVEEVRKYFFVPVIFLTAAQEKWVMDEINKIDKSVCLVKPFEQQDLLKMIESFLPQIPGVPF